MKQGILCNHRVRLLFKKGMSCYRERRKGCRKRKSVRGCVVGPDLATLSLVLVKKGPEELPGLTDDNRPRRLGPKRASTSGSCSPWRRRTTCATLSSAATPAIRKRP